MKSITIQLDPDLAERIETRARREGRALNQTVRALLRSALGFRKPEPIDHRDDFADLFGSWSANEAAAFEARIEESRTVDARNWNR